MNPPIDRAQLQHIVAALTDGVILIEPDQRIGWANDAALTMHGATRLEELGRTVDEYRARFELKTHDARGLPPGTAPMERLIAGECFSEVIVQVGKPGQPARWTHQIRSLVLTAIDGQPHCLVLIITDLTEQVDAEQRFESAFNANPAPAIICRLADLRYIKVNCGFLELSGYTADALLGHNMHEVDVLAGAERRAEAIACLNAGKTIAQMESLLPVAGGGSRTVLLGGQPIEVADAPCMLFTFADLHPRQQALEALGQSERRFATSFHMAPVPMLIVARAGGRLLDVNQSFVREAGYARDDALGRTEAELDLWSAVARERIARSLHADGHVASLDVVLRDQRGRHRDYLLSAEEVDLDGQRCVLVVMQNIGERKRTESELLTAIEAVLHDTSWFGQRVMEKLAEMPARLSAPDDRAGGPGGLSPREREVLGLIAQGLGNSDISRKLEVSLSTVRNHVNAVYGKIGVNTRGQAVVWARERGFFAVTASHSAAPSDET